MRFLILIGWIVLSPRAQAQITEEYIFDTNQSKACNICVLKDSLQIVSTAIYEAKKRGQDYSELELYREYLHILYGEEVKTYAALNGLADYEAQVEWHSKNSCIQEYPFLTDTIARDSLFLRYVSYAYYSAVPKIISPVPALDDYDRTIDGLLIIRFQGDSVFLDESDFSQYWSEVVIALDDLTDYVESQKEAFVIAITGKQYSNLDLTERAMFHEHADRVNLLFGGKQKILESDRQFQELSMKFRKAGLNQQ